MANPQTFLVPVTTHPASLEAIGIAAQMANPHIQAYFERRRRTASAWDQTESFVASPNATIIPSTGTESGNVEPLRPRQRPARNR